MNGGKILVIRGGAIGDFILTLPVLTALRTQFPEADLEVLGYEHIASLAVEGGLASAVRRIDARPLAGFFARGGALDPGLEQYFAEFSVIVSYLYDPDQIFQTNVARCSRAQFVVGPHRPDEKGDTHATEVYLRPLERLAIFDADPVPTLRLRTADVPVRSSNVRMALHPGSGSERKNWPEKNWAQLLKELSRGAGIDLLLVGGEAEEGRLERLAVALPPSRVKMAKSLPLPQLSTLLKECTAFAGHDSGISHLAAALGLPTFVLWGETPQVVWQPRGKQVRILNDPGSLARLRVEQVFQALSAYIRP